MTQVGQKKKKKKKIEEKAQVVTQESWRIVMNLETTINLQQRSWLCNLPKKAEHKHTWIREQRRHNFEVRLQENKRKSFSIVQRYENRTGIFN